MPALFELLEPQFVQKLLDACYQSNGMPLRLLDARDGSVLAAAGNPGRVASKQPGSPPARTLESVRYQRRSEGLWDAELPLILDDQLLAILHSGGFHLVESARPAKSPGKSRARTRKRVAPDRRTENPSLPCFDRPKAKAVLDSHRALARLLLQIADYNHQTDSSKTKATPQAGEPPITGNPDGQDPSAREQGLRDIALVNFALNSIREAVFMVGEDAGFLYVNQEACRLLEYTREELLGLSIPDVAPAYPLQRWAEHWRDLKEQRTLTFEGILKSKNGRVFPVEINASFIAYEGRDYNLGLVRDISERKRDENIKQARLRLLEFSTSHSLDEFLTATLDEIEALTGSCIGFYHFLEADQKTLSLQNWSTNTLKKMCTAEGKGSHYAVAKAGVWVDCVHQRRPVIHNDYASLPHRKGMPKGHAPVVREVVVPIFRGSQIKAIIGVGNKTSDYTEQDIETVLQLGDLSWDIAEAKRAEEERLAHLRFLESLDQVNQVIRASNDLEQMMKDVLAAVVSIFDCDRAFLVYPCDPEADSWRAPMECTRPEFPGVFDQRLEIPMDPEVQRVQRTLRAANSPVSFGPDAEHPLPAGTTEQFSIQAMLAMAIYPKNDQPYMFGLHQCSRRRIWTEGEQRLFREIGRRLTDALTSLRAYRGLQDSEIRYREVFENTSNIVVVYEVTEERRFRLLDVNPAWEKVTGRSRSAIVGKFLDELIRHPSADAMLENAKKCLEQKTTLAFEQATRSENESWHMRTTLIPLCADGGKIYRLIGISQDITEMKKAEEEHKARLRFFQCLDQVNQAIRGSNDLEKMLSDVLGVVLSKLECDRVFLLYPCLPGTPVWRIAMERTRPEYPGVAVGEDQPAVEDDWRTYRLVRETDGPVHFGPGSEHALPKIVSEAFGIQSMLSMAIYPKNDQAYMFGLQQCSRPRVWDEEEKRLMREIGRRLTDALTSTLAYRNLRDSELRYREVFDNTSNIVVVYEVGDSGRLLILDVNQAWKKIVGLDREVLVGRYLDELQQHGAAVEALGRAKQCLEQKVPVAFEHDVSSQGRTWRFHTTLIPLKNAEGKIYRLIGISLDITEQKRAEEEHLARFRFFKCLDQVNQAIRGTNDLEQMVGNVLDAIFSIFDCDRVFLLSPCDPKTEEWRVIMARARPEYSVYQVGTVFPADDEDRKSFRIVREADGPVYFGPGSEHTLPRKTKELFQDQSMLSMALYPKNDHPYMLGMNQCSRPRIWTEEERRLFREIGRRMTDALTSLLAYRNLRDSELRYREIFENANDLISIYDLEPSGRLRLVNANPAWKKYAGSAYKNLIGKFVEEIAEYDPGTAEVLSAAKQCVERKAAIALESMVFVKSGSWFFHTTMIPLFDETGQIYRVLGVGRDITEQKKAEEALRESEERWRRMIEYNPVCLCLHENGRVVYANEMFINLVGAANLEQIRGKHVLDFVHPDFHEIARERVRRMVEEDDLVETIEEKFVRLDGRVVDVEITGIPMKYLGRKTAFTVCWDITQRKQAEQALAESQQRVSDVFDFLPDATFAVDREGKVIAWNRAIEDLTGWKAEQLMGKGDYEYSLPFYGKRRPILIDLVFKPIEEIRANYEYVKIEGDMFVAEADVPLRGGEIRRLWGKIRPLYDSQRNIAGAIETIRDITEQKRSEQALLDSRRRLSDIFDFLPDATFAIDREGKVIAWNRAIEEMTGVKAQDILGKGDFEYALPFYGIRRPILCNLVTSTDEKMLAEKYHVIKREGGVLLAEVEVRIWGGEPRVLWVKATALYDSQGNLTGAIEAIRDITQRKRAEDDLRDSQLFLDSLVEQSPYSVWISDQQGTMLRMNQACRELLQVEDRELVGKYNVLQDNVVEEQGLMPLIRNLFEKGETARFELIYDTGRLQTLPLEKQVRRILEVTAFPVRNAAGKATNFVVQHIDISRRKQAEAEREALITDLEIKNAELERYSYTVSHDLKNPLITIKGFASLLDKSAETHRDREMKEFIDRIAGAADRMQLLLRDLLALSRAGRVMNAPEEISLGDMAHDIVNSIQGQIRERGITVTIAPGLPVIWGDKLRLREVFENLLDNAIKYMGDQPDPQIEIGARNQDGEPVFYVRDNGVGVEPKYHQRIFGLFERLDADFSKGSGVGLAIVKRIVELHQGRVWIESEGLGRGSRFCFTLPQRNDKKGRPDHAE